MVIITLSYDDTDMTPEDEAEIRLWHYDGFSWQDITTYQDSFSNRITGQTADLSPFVLGRVVTPTTCCGQYIGGLTGNTNCSSDGKVNLADINRMIDRVYLSKTVLCCEENGNTDGDVDGKMNLADVNRLIDKVYLSKTDCEPCI